MKSNSLFTYVIYALLLGLILIAGYKACQIRQEQALQKKEREELEQVMRNLGYTNDSTANGSTTSAALTAAQSLPKVRPSRRRPPNRRPRRPKYPPNGIEEDEPAAKTAKPATNTAKPLTSAPTTTSTSAKTSTSTQPSTLSGNVPSTVAATW